MTEIVKRAVLAQPAFTFSFSLPFLDSLHPATVELNPLAPSLSFIVMILKRLDRSIWNSFPVHIITLPQSVYHMHKARHMVGTF